MRQKFSSTYHHCSFKDATSHTLEQYREELAALSTLRTGEYKSHEHSLRLPVDASLLSEVQHVAKRYFSSQLKYVIVIGIGGQNLGAKAVYDALRGSFDLGLRDEPKLLFLDTISGEALTSVEEILAEKVHYPEELLVVLSSKSGTTTETIANFELLYASLEKRFSSIQSRVVVISDHGSALWKFGEKEGYSMLPMPKMVGGRFSIFSASGLLPLLLAGINISDFREGAADMLQNSVIQSPDNHARRNAEALFGAMKEGKSIFNIFHFNPSLESLGKWERQLVAESLGKECDAAGKVVHAGITPIVSIGSTDLHSMAQLYLGGPRDKFTMFVHASEHFSRAVPKNMKTNLVSGIANKKPAEIMDAIFGGVIGAYHEHRFPFNDVHLSLVSPYTLGAYMEWRMASVMYLAKLMHVNAFDQPNVEDYKKGTREILGRSK